MLHGLLLRFVFTLTVQLMRRFLRKILTFSGRANFKDSFLSVKAAHSVESHHHHKIKNPLLLVFKTPENGKAADVIAICKWTPGVFTSLLHVRYPGASVVTNSTVVIIVQYIRISNHLNIVFSLYDFVSCTIRS